MNKKIFVATPMYGGQCAGFKADLAVFARYLNDYQVELVGAITRAEFVAVHQLKNFGYGDNCVVDPLLLNDVRDYL